MGIVRVAEECRKGGRWIGGIPRSKPQPSLHFPEKGFAVSEHHSDKLDLPACKESPATAFVT